MLKVESDQVKEHQSGEEVYVVVPVTVCGATGSGVDAEHPVIIDLSLVGAHGNMQSAAPTFKRSLNWTNQT